MKKRIKKVKAWAVIYRDDEKLVDMVYSWEDVKKYHRAQVFTKVVPCVITYSLPANMKKI